MQAETSALGKYRLCPNTTIKGFFFIGLCLEVVTLTLAIAMLSLGGWIEISFSSASSADSKYVFCVCVMLCFLNLDIHKIDLKEFYKTASFLLEQQVR